MTQLEGRVALVTGGARGIGAATAEALADAGAAVMITDVLDAEGGATAARLDRDSTRVLFRHHDVSDEADWARVVADCEATLGGLDILVNNAGILLVKPLLETSIEEFRRVQSVNVEGTFLGIKAAMPAIGRRADQWRGGGSIINLSSLGGLVGSPSAIAYCGSKGSIRLMTKAAALECTNLGLRIRVNSVHPGRIDTDMFRDAMRGLDGVPRQAGQVGTPADIANAILFLASDAAAFVTGSELVADGGFTAQ